MQQARFRVTCVRSCSASIVYHRRLFPSYTSEQIYQPCLANSLTLVQVALNPSLNLALHLSLLSLFLFRPGRSWNRCLIRSCEILFLLTSEFNSCRPLARSTLPPLPQCTVRPMLGRSRSLTSMMDSFLCWWAAAKSSAAGRGALFRSAKMPRSSMLVFLEGGPLERRARSGWAQGLPRLLLVVPGADADDEAEEEGFWERKEEYMLEVA